MSHTILWSGKTKKETEVFAMLNIKTKQEYVLIRQSGTIPTSISPFLERGESVFVAKKTVESLNKVDK